METKSAGSAQPDPGGGHRAGPPAGGDRVRHQPGPVDRRAGRGPYVPVGDRGPVPLHRAGCRHLHRDRRRVGAVGDAQRRAGRPLRLVGREGPGAVRAGRGEHARRGRRLRVLQQWAGPAPHGGPGRRRDLPLQPVRDGRRAAGLRLLRPARPEERLHLARDRPRPLARGVQHAGGARGAGRRGAQDRPLRGVGPDEHLHHRALRRAVPRGAGQPRRHRPGRLLPGLDGAAPRLRRAVPDHQAGLRLLPRAVRGALPAAQVRPALGTGLQRRRDGELRLRHARRVALPVPLPGHRLRVRAAGQHDPARAGAHVVR